MKPKIQKYVCIFVKLNCYSSNNNFCKSEMDFKEACISRIILKCSYGGWELPLFLQTPEDELGRVDGDVLQWIL